MSCCPQPDALPWQLSYLGLGGQKPLQLQLSRGPFPHCLLCWVWEASTEGGPATSTPDRDVTVLCNRLEEAPGPWK